ncbi:hypothetical protein MPH_12820 [Macrophomina phaseolina MS6]|uniref:Uncharacterized protein n=1 Tax=Macrophomina phaseolina (strain MS6) TaxID=1126212 RepID=K2RJ23_MACPH|nr:hypothetical protein MPH_12820 [Macrophomina phaseolina MS6]
MPSQKIRLALERSGVVSSIRTQVFIRPKGDGFRVNTSASHDRGADEEGTVSCFFSFAQHYQTLETTDEITARTEHWYGKYASLVDNGRDTPNKSAWPVLNHKFLAPSLDHESSERRHRDWKWEDCIHTEKYINAYTDHTDR